MIGTSFPEYVFIRINIFLLQYTTPICLVYLLALITIKGGGVILSLSGTIAIGYAIADTIYALFIYYPYNRRLKHEAEHPPLLPRTERRELFLRCLDNIPDITSYLRNWFLGANAADIRQENVQEFLSWAFFDRHPGNETAAELEELDEYVAEVEKRMGHQLQPGRGKARSLRLTLDEIEVRYRSVIWYFIVGVVDLSTHLRLLRHGFRHYAQPSHLMIPLRPQSIFTTRQSVSKLSYMYRPHTSRDKLPLVFLHGIGIGLWPYTQFLSFLNEAYTDDDQVGIIALEYLPVSARLTSAPLSQAEFLSEISLILSSHGWDRFVVVGHSYGTVLATHMLKSPSLSPRIQSIILIDPVCILLHLPDVAYNFTRRKPRGANEYLLWYFASMDPGVAHCLGRHFFWKDNIAWKEDLLGTVGQLSNSEGISSMTSSKEGHARKVMVCLAEVDLIVDTKTVRQYLLNDGDWISVNNAPNNPSNTRTLADNVRVTHFERNGIEVVWFDGLDHAQAFDGRDSSAHLAAITRRSCAPSER
ncbi:hypothetical protein F5B22DRAFT_282443 [Xylaria bambusicola]|uniref:uncharacterized protein n=1 Tax=Xylaria bambusicola TaxID=326684 RepID=UPI002007581E|nr:uncharacterized protein F5B22DRAFT_282443 [Xylaria bambusicola]KAI0512986.1 hypothetical protein F5B22DRAFT_282443 [Xylaria bambusicola]